LDELLERLRNDYLQFFSKKLRVGLTLVPQTICWLHDSVSYFLAKGVTDIRVAPDMTAFSHWRFDQIHELDRAFAAVFDSCIRHYRRTGRVPLGLFRKSDPNEIADRSRRDMCNVASGDKAAVDVDGQVLGCVTFAESYQRFPTAFLRNRLEALKMGSVQSDELPRRMAAYPAAARATALFTDKQNKYSSYGRCGECQYLATCGICPVSIGHQPGNSDPNLVPDFLCAYNLISQKYRERFPCMPTALDILLGRAPVPELTRALERLTAGSASA
jgi:radical SAM protein with 4Fe4S-binding SPASM domain